MKCKQHPKYLAKRKPRVLCEDCWRMWIAALNSRAWVDYAKDYLKNGPNSGMFELLGPTQVKALKR